MYMSAAMSLVKCWIVAILGSNCADAQKYMTRDGTFGQFFEKQSFVQKK